MLKVSVRVAARVSRFLKMRETDEVVVNIDLVTCRPADEEVQV